MKYELIPVEKIRALEMVFPHHLENLRQMILKDNHITVPLIVEDKHNIVLDGSHRHVFFLMEGYEYAPVCYVNYSDPHIRVGTHLMHRHVIKGQLNISKAEVIRRGITGDLYPPRTTRHFFPFRKSEAEIPLRKLGQMEPRDVSEHIFDCNIDDEITHNKKYINEIEEEIDEVIRYLEEIRLTKTYLNEQIKLMNNWKNLKQ